MKNLLLALLAIDTWTLLGLTLKLSGKVIPKLLGVKVLIGAILKIYVDIKPASLGTLSKATSLLCELAKELDKIVREDVPEDA